MLAKDYRAKAWTDLSGKWGTMVIVTVVYALIIGGCNVVPGIGSIASLILQGPLALGMAFVALKVIRSQEISLDDLFDGLRGNRFVPALVLSLLNALFVVLWSLLFVIPGIIKTYAYAMSTYIMADNPGMSQKECREESMRMMMGNKWRLFCLHFSFIGWGLLSALTFGILGLWVAGYMNVAEAAFYEDLKARRAA